MDDSYTSDPVLQDITFDPSTIQQAEVVQTNDSGSSWAGLDNVGSGVSNVATNILGSFGNLVSAQINKTALLTATGAVGRSNTAAPTANPNSWKTYALVAVVIIAGVAVFHVARKR